VLEGLHVGLVLGVELPEWGLELGFKVGGLGVFQDDVAVEAERFVGFELLGDLDAVVAPLFRLGGVSILAQHAHVEGSTFVEDIGVGGRGNGVAAGWGGKAFLLRDFVEVDGLIGAVAIREEGAGARKTAGVEIFNNIVGLEGVVELVDVAESFIGRGEEFASLLGSH
jgi:hypothetical protein